jgi:hypothetical protein
MNESQKPKLKKYLLERKRINKFFVSPEQFQNIELQPFRTKASNVSLNFHLNIHEIDNEHFQNGS